MLSLQKHITVLRSALDPDRLPVMVKKVTHRFLDQRSQSDMARYREWLVENAVPVDQWCAETDGQLWEETRNFADTLNRRWHTIRQELPEGLGGNACFRLLYFLTRRFRPETVVETGVALGFSSQALLAAMNLNGRGRLYSSDFPYFRIPGAEKYIGAMVDDGLKENWKLYIRGDEKNLPEIMSQIEKIDLLHYDSDKTYEGRKKGLRIVGRKITPETLILLDDIQDNPHFYDFVTLGKMQDWQVLENRGGFIGMINGGRKP